MERQIVKKVRADKCSNAKRKVDCKPLRVSLKMIKVGKNYDNSCASKPDGIGYLGR